MMHLKTASYHIAEAVVRLGFRFFTRTTIAGRENVPLRGPILVVCNHIEMADIPLLAAVLPRRLTFMAKEELWLSPVLRVLANWYQAFPVYRKAIDTTALRRSLAALKREQALVVFPEGTRSLQHASLLPGQPGAALIALRSTAPVLPIAITGTEKAKGLSWLWNRPKLVVNIGRPFTLVRTKDKSIKHQLGVDTRTIMQNIASLLPPSYHGAYGK